jgi:hypothetical protein
VSRVGTRKQRVYRTGAIFSAISDIYVKIKYPSDHGRNVKLTTEVKKTWSYTCNLPYAFMA